MKKIIQKKMQSFVCVICRQLFGKVCLPKNINEMMPTISEAHMSEHKLKVNYRINELSKQIVNFSLHDLLTYVMYYVDI